MDEFQHVLSARHSGSENLVSFYRKILDHAQEAILIVQDNQIVLFNEKLLEYTGYEREELDSMPAVHLIFPADKDLLEDGFRHIRLKEHDSYVFTFRMLDKAGEVRWMESKIMAIDFNDVPSAIFYIYDISEFKQAEEAVNVSIDFLNTLIDTIPNPMFYKNTRGVFIGCNNSFVNFIGKGKEHIIGKTIYEIVPEDIAMNLHHLNMKVVNKHGYHIKEAKMPHADGSMHDVISYHATFYLSDRSIGGVVGILTDVSEQKHVEQQLRFSEFRYRQLVNNLNVGVMVLNPRQNGTRFIISEVNIAAAKILGVKKEDILGRSWNDFFKDDVNQELYQNLRRVWECAEPLSYKDSRFVQQTEQLLTHFVYKVPSGDLVNIISDVTVAEQTRLLLKDSEEKHRFMIDNSTDCILKLDAESGVVFASKAFLQAADLPIEQVAGKNFLQFIQVEHRIYTHDRIELLKKNGGSLMFENLVIFTSGSRWFSWSAKIEMDYSSKNQAIVIIGHDITLSKETEIALIEAKKKAEESNRLKSAFVANMSHEIRTPLNAIIGSSELIASESLSAMEIKEHLNYIMGSGKSLLNLINEIIDSAKIEAGKISIQKVDFEISALMHEIYGLFIPQSKMFPNVNYLLEADVELGGFWANTDPYRVKQIVNNLLSNAFKFTDKGSIAIRYGLENYENNLHLLRIEVCDTGVGIPPEKFQAIFTRFGQIEAHQYRNQKGTGLGLSIAKQLAELLGGSIGVRSELGKGSSFTLTVPVRIDQQSPSRSANEHRERNVYNWANYVVLVAEDNQINYMILNKGLSQTKIQVLWAKNGLQACEMCAEKKPDIVLMDMQMPELDGYEATTRIKMLQPHLPIIAQTASALYEDRQRVLNAGCDDFIPKPIDIVHLLSKMEYLLKKTPPKGKAL